MQSHLEPRAYLEARVDKFIFRVATDRRYSPDGAWAVAADGRVRVGVSDFTQQRNGDVAFVEVRPAGWTVGVGDEVALIETIKANVEVGSPVAGRVAQVNPALGAAPELINQDPYGDGWLALVEPNDWARDMAALLAPEAYLEVMRGQAEDEVGKP